MPNIATFKPSVPLPIVRVTVPLASPIAWTPGSSLFTVQAPDGRKLQTQCEVVRRDADDDAAVVEVIARDPMPSVGVYNVLEEEQTDRSPKLSGWGRELLGEPPRFSVGNGLTIETQWETGYYRNGDVCQTRRFAGPHVAGWLTVFRDHDAVEMEFKLHDAAPSSPHWFFRELALVNAPPYVSVMPEPLGNATHLIAPRVDGKLHALPQMKQRHFRLVLGRTMGDALAHKGARGGRAICDAWTKVKGWGPTEQRLPNLPAQQLSNARNWLASEASKRINGMASGDAVEMGLALGVGQVGIGYTTGSKYGGVTGGGGRELYDQVGMWAAMTQSLAGIDASMIEAAAVAWRQPIIVAQDGRVAEMQDFQQPNGVPMGNWQVSSASSNFERQGNEQNYHDGAFGFRAVRSQMPAPGTYDAAELAELLSIAPVDFQHYVRALSAAQSLVYLTNDPMAKHDMLAMAEWHRMSMDTDGRLLGEASRVTSNPHKLTYWGRGQGHGFDAQAAAFGVATVKWRTERRTELSMFARTIRDAQAANGCLQATVGHKVQKEAPFTVAATNTADATSKLTETTILAHAAVGCARATGGVDVDEMILNLAVDGVAKFHGAASMSAAWDWTAVRPMNPQAEPYAAPPTTANNDNSEYPIVLGMALQICHETGTQPPQPLLDAIRRRCGNSASPAAWLDAQSLYNLMLDDMIVLRAALE